MFRNESMRPANMHADKQFSRKRPVSRKELVVLQDLNCSKQGNALIERFRSLCPGKWLITGSPE
jgi:hypothetical protein